MKGFLNFVRRFLLGAGILFPLVSLGMELGMELGTRSCASMIFDPVPTWAHVVLVLLMPAAIFFPWMGRKRPGTAWESAGVFLHGAGLFPSILYTLAMGYLNVMGLMMLPVMLFYAFASPGTLLIIPFIMAMTGPLAALVAWFITCKGVWKLPVEKRRRPWRGGMALGLIAIAATEWSMMSLHADLGTAMQAARTHDGSAAKILPKLRTKWREEFLLNLCYTEGQAGVFGPLTHVFFNQSASFTHWRRSRTSSFDREALRSLYFRVTGVPFSDAPPPHGMAQTRSGMRMTRDDRMDGFAWDEDRGGAEVGARMRGLSMQSSRMDWHVDEDSALAHGEWTLEFHNQHRNAQEARCQMLLPPGACVSRLTLWINGEPREAAFGARAQVTQAYRETVAQRRDPVLVNMVGPDRVLTQCFPVPSNGSMKIRLGITAPLDAQAPSALSMPLIVERNFSIPAGISHAVWVQAPHALEVPQEWLQAAATQRGGWMWQAEVPQPKLAGLSFGVKQPPLPKVWTRDKLAGNEFPIVIVERVLRPAFVRADTPAMQSTHASSIHTALNAIEKDVKHGSHWLPQPRLSAENEQARLSHGVTQPPLPKVSAMERDEITTYFGATDAPSDALKPVFIIVDASASLRPHAATIREALKQLAHKTPVTVWASTDGDAIEVPVAEIDTRLQSSSFDGGRDAVPAFKEALKRLRETSAPTTLIWLHGPQAAKISGEATVKQLLERGGVRPLIHALELEHGRNTFLEEMYDAAPIVSGVRWQGGGADALASTLLHIHHGPATAAKISRSATEPADGKEVWDQLARHAVFREVMAVFQGRDQVPEEQAKRAAQHQLVTPYSGAVVLENKQQYDRAGLKPVDESSTPQIPTLGTPEPSRMLLVVLGLSALCLRRRRRLASR